MCGVKAQTLTDIFVTWYFYSFIDANELYRAEGNKFVLGFLIKGYVKR